MQSFELRLIAVSIAIAIASLFVITLLQPVALVLR